MAEVKRFSEDFEHIGRTVNQNDRLLIENSETGEENYVRIADIDPANATVVALAAAEAAPKTITLISITTLPSASSHSVGDKAYQLSDKKIYTVSNAGDEWVDPVSPRLIDKFLFDGRVYDFVNDQLIDTAMLAINAGTDAENAAIDAMGAKNAIELVEAAITLFEAYNGSHSYIVGNKVSYNGSTYQCIQNTTNHVPTNVS